MEGGFVEVVVLKGHCLAMLLVEMGFVYFFEILLKG